ncbi:MAG: hypothetical protein NTZ83_03915 [Candidatus Pacearchaeota archaeon]|nr:hypothetical protein [Candidatus Pacearchaeota archaeon]
MALEKIVKNKKSNISSNSQVHNKYSPLDQLKNYIQENGLVDVSPSELEQPLYFRIYRTALKNNIELNEAWKYLGINQKVIIKSFETLKDLIKYSLDEDFFGKDLKDLSPTDTGRIRKFAKDNKIDLDVIYDNLKIKKEGCIYETLEDIKNDLKEKGLEGKTPEDIIEYDKHKTYKNIREFAKRNELSIPKFLDILGIKFSDRTKLVDGKLMTKEKYSSIQEVKDDLKKKGLLNSFIKDVSSYDGDVTYMNIQRFAKRNGLDIKDIYTECGIKYASRKDWESNPIPAFYSVSDIKSFLEKNNMSGISLKELRSRSKKAQKAILDFAKDQEMERGEIWKILGIKNKIKIVRSIEDLIEELKENRLRDSTVKEIRRTSTGNRIYEFARKNNIPAEEIWRVLGIKNAYGR